MSEIAKQTVPTKQVLNEYYGGERSETDLRVRCQVDREELYDYEKKIGKQLFEMNVDELFDMIQTFGSKRKTVKGASKMGYNSFFQICSMYRQIFNYYIDNYQIIRNPFNDKSMKGNNALERLMAGQERFTQENVDTIIYNLQHDLPEERANYIECIVRLFCDGFATNEEIVLLNESMIDFKKRQVILPGRIVKLSDRTFTLLNYVHSLEEMAANHGFYRMVTYKNNYFKYTVFERNVKSFSDKPIGEVAALLSRALIVYIRRPYNMDVNYRTFFLFGFYKKLVETYGEERVREMVLATRNSEYTNDIYAMARLYGVNTSNITTLRKSLRIYV